VVQVPVGQQHRDRLQPVLVEERVELVGDADAGVDDDALLALCGRDDPAVRPEGGRLETPYEHCHLLLIRIRRQYRGRASVILLG